MVHTAEIPVHEETYSVASVKAQFLSVMSVVRAALASGVVALSPVPPKLTLLNGEFAARRMRREL